MIELRTEIFLAKERPDGITTYHCRKNVYQDGILVAEQDGGAHVISIMPGQGVNATGPHQTREQAIAFIIAENERHLAGELKCGPLCAVTKDDIDKRTRRTHTTENVARMQEIRAAPIGSQIELPDWSVTEVREDIATGVVLYRLRNVKQPWQAIEPGQDVGQFIDKLRGIAWYGLGEEAEQDIELRCARAHTPEKVELRARRLADS